MTDDRHPPEGLFYSPLVERIISCDMKIQRPERRYHQWIGSERFHLGPEPEIVIEFPPVTLELELIFGTEHSSALFETFDLVYLQLNNLQWSFFITAMIRSYVTECRDHMIRTCATFEGWIMQQIRHETNTMDFLWGTLTPTPTWLHEHAEGNVQVEIQLTEGSILL